jgi:putative ABC transport system substrate-binding protein
MDRRAFIVGGAAALAASLAAAAQQENSPVRIGFLPLGSPTSAYDQSLVEAFRQGLRDAGLIENRHVVIEVLWVPHDSEYPRAAGQLVQRGAKLLVPCGTSASLAAKRQAPPTLPILFISVGNPVGIGLVESLSHPGGNATGFSDVLADLSGKLLAFATQLGKPQAAVHYLWYTGWADGQHRFQATERAAQAAGVKLQPRGIGDKAEIDDSLATMKRAGAATVIIQPSPFTYRERARLIESAAGHRLATIFAFPPAAREGALMAYGPDYAHMYRRAGAAVDRLLKGRKPADLPVEQPTKFVLVVNLKTAKALGLTMPQALLLQADEVIE